ncbi:ductus ejaculatorius peptide 99B [Drosophila eugracilis]|uniref:ductus ejaculatorius peptide 99B n=1 Tax=Drosophila eugracilis TaxID=29029 RepID=UPI0007E63E68|nr:ductus ejaculatorius peptide 99B [Drosophila eugracilis]
MKILLVFLFVLVCFLGMALSQNRSDPEWIQAQKDRERWCRLNLGPAWGGKCRK